MMRLEKTTTGLIIHEPTDDIKEKCLQYFSLTDPIREYFVYSGKDPNSKITFGKERDVIYISSGFLKINDPVIKRLMMIRKLDSPTPSPVKIEMSREPRSDLQRDCIKKMTESKSTKLTVELKPGVGKAEPYSRKIPTPTSQGYTLMGDLKVGDYVFNKEGMPVKVTNIFEQGVQDIYKITFQDGRTAFCHKEHLWYVKCGKNGSWKVKKLSDMLDDFKTESKWRKEHNREDIYNYNYYIPMCDPVNYPEQLVPIDPWVLGCFIGNGCCTCKLLTISCPDDEIPKRIANICGFTVYKNPANYSYQFKYPNGRTVQTSEFFKDIPEVCNHIAHEKTIPLKYIINNTRVRLELLRGLMDTDGYISQERFNVTYTSTSKILLKQIQQIIYSLGWTSSLRADTRVDKYTNNFCGIVTFKIPNRLKPLLFTISRKQLLAQKAAEKEQHNYYDDLLIKNIELSHKENCRCIMVDDSKHLYLTEDYIVTHNTFISMYSASKLGLKPLIVAPSTLLKNQWIENLEECGISRNTIATNIYDAPNKLCCVVTISSIENALRDDWDGLLKVIHNSNFGIKIIDEAHLHLKGMLKLDSLCNIKYNWYLSATLGRSDAAEDRILNMALLDADRFVGNKKYEEYQTEYIHIYKQDIVYNPSAQLCRETFKYGKKGLIRATYYQMLLKYKGGVPFITNMVTMIKKTKSLTKSDKKILVLVPMIEIIHRLQGRLEVDPYFKDMNIVMVDGSMSISQKRSNLENGDLILSTTQSMGVGVDVSDLIAVINFDQLASPISLEQIVGRLRNRGYDTIYIDICDHVRYAKTLENWGKQRRMLYPYFPGVYKEMYQLPNIYS